MVTILESLNRALLQVLSDDPQALLIGEDILDPYGGAFKVTQGCSTLYPDRVLASPISEAAIVGVATGMAMRGLHPIVEIMFGDFITLIADQLINHLTKFRWMYNDQVRVPLVIRTPMGGYRGYGPTHSQTLEKIFLGIPGIKVVAVNSLSDPGKLLYDVVLSEQDPVLFIEHKLLYPLPIFDETLNRDLLRTSLPANSAFPTYRLTLRGAPDPQLTILAYGYMVELASQALLKLAYEEEIFCEVIVPTQLAPFEITPLLDFIRKTKHLITLEEGTRPVGWGAEILAQIMEQTNYPPISAARIAAKDHPIPASPILENNTLPGLTEIIHVAHLILNKS
ncbi:MAG: alpha-ketoacid dehydrogenase subunit beta [Anaerolineales bacterium]